jgi:predicted small lipoprotein YifL
VSRYSAFRLGRTCLTLLLVAAALVACGKKGTLEPPGGQPSAFPRQYPAPSALAPAPMRPIDEPDEPEEEILIFPERRREATPDYGVPGTE